MLTPGTELMLPGYSGKIGLFDYSPLVLLPQRLTGEKYLVDMNALSAPRLKRERFVVGLSDHIAKNQFIYYKARDQ